jgi:excisionase family DNA binding protein
MTVEEAAGYTKFGGARIQELVRSNTIPHIHSGAEGRRVLIPIAALDAWLYTSAVLNMEPSPVRSVLEKESPCASATA